MTRSYAPAAIHARRPRFGDPLAGLAVVLVPRGPVAAPVVPEAPLSAVMRRRAEQAEAARLRKAAHAFARRIRRAGQYDPTSVRHGPLSGPPGGLGGREGVEARTAEIRLEKIKNGETPAGPETLSRIRELFRGMVS